jgi:hypothetical protein
MKAIIWVSDKKTRLMTQIIDRPYVQHLLEQLVRRNIGSVSLYLNSPEPKLRELLGDGTRWGIDLQIHEAASIPVHELCDSSQQGLALLCDASWLPALPHFSQETEGISWPSLFFHDRNLTSQWTGWAMMPENLLAAFSSQIMSGVDWRTAASRLSLSFHKVFLEVSSLNTSGAAQTLESNRIALTGAFPELSFYGLERESGIWVARGAKVPASAKLEAPVYIGENAWIGEGCQIGPEAVIGQNCVIEKGTRVCHSVVARGTFLGPELEVNESVVEHNKIENTRLEVALEIEEAHVASSLSSSDSFPFWMNCALGAMTLLTITLIWIR